MRKPKEIDPCAPVPTIRIPTTSCSSTIKVQICDPVEPSGLPLTLTTPERNLATLPTHNVRMQSQVAAYWKPDFGISLVQHVMRKTPQAIASSK